MLTVEYEDLRVTIGKTAMKSFHFVTKQEKPFKINMLRVAAKYFPTLLTRQYESIYIMALGDTPLQLGVVNSLGRLAGASAALPTGWSVDRYGLRKTILFGTFLMALGALLFALATNWMVVIPAMTIATLAVRVPKFCGGGGM